MARKTTEEEFNYILKYIQESVDHRGSLKQLAYRAKMAYKGQPMINSYKSGMYSYGQTIKDANHKKQFLAMCAQIQEKTNMTVHNSVETVVSMAMGGAGQYEFGPSDKYLAAPAELVDELCYFGEWVYDINKIDSLLPQALRTAALQGASYFVIHPEKEDECFKIDLVGATKMLNDPYRMKTNRSRYRGYTQMESWSELKDHIKKDKGGYKLSSVNKVDAYLAEVSRRFEGEELEDMRYGYCVDEHINTFYHDIGASAQIFHENNKDDDAKFNYVVDEVEVAYMYDYKTNKLFKVINREFIVNVKSKPLEKNYQV